VRYFFFAYNAGQLRAVCCPFFFRGWFVHSSFGLLNLILEQVASADLRRLCLAVVQNGKRVLPFGGCKWSFQAEVAPSAEIPPLPCFHPRFSARPERPAFIVGTLAVELPDGFHVLGIGSIRAAKRTRKKHNKSRQINRRDFLGLDGFRRLGVLWFIHDFSCRNPAVSALLRSWLGIGVLDLYYFQFESMRQKLRSLVLQKVISNSHGVFHLFDKP